MKLWAELSGENISLAIRELSSVLKMINPDTPSPTSISWEKRLCSFETDFPLPLASRLAYTHRLLRPVANGSLSELERAIREEGSAERSAAIRAGRWVHLSEKMPALLGRAYVEGGGLVDLERPERTFVVFADSGRPPSIFSIAEEVVKSSRLAIKRRLPAALPFRKPVTLSPLLARALANLSEVPPGGLLLDPFCGTGMILIEGGLLGCHLVAADTDGRMVKGTLANLERFELHPERAIQIDVGELPSALEGLPPLDGVATDPPYGRASSTGGERPEKVLDRMLDRLPSLLRRGAKVALMVPYPDLKERLKSHWVMEEGPIPLRIHRSLTRWIYELRLPSN